MYVFVSFRLFCLTNDLKNVAIPGKDMTLLWRNGAIMAVAAVTLYASGALTLRSFSMLGLSR